MAAPAPLKSLVETGTKLWLDSIDPALIGPSIESGVTGATSNPIIVSDLIKTGRFDDAIREAAQKGLDNDAIAWDVTNQLVSNAEEAFKPIFDSTKGNDGYVSFELDPLIEDGELNLPHAERIKRYIELGKKWAAGHPNRMIKVPATPAGLESLEELAAAGISLNVTLIFSEQQYVAARDAVWAGAKRRDNLGAFKSVYSIFVSRIDVYTQKQVPQLNADAQGTVGIVNAQRIWKLNQEFWSDKGCPLDQEIVFASTGTKNPEDPAWKYVAALAGSDIQTNPPATNDAVASSSVAFTRLVDQLPNKSVLENIDQCVDFEEMERVLMSEGLDKFSNPQKALLELINSKREQLVSAT
ncbi:MAG: transaldolase family protein [Pirellulaceae bacterium]